MTRVIAHVDRLIVKGLRVADPASFGSAMKIELAENLAGVLPADPGRRQARELRTEHVVFDKAAGVAYVAREVARKIAQALCP